MTPRERWLAATWPLVRSRLPPAPARVVELGCGPFGGHVERLRAAGYDALGVDPEAPPGEHYRRVEFEHADLPAPVDAVVASTSLHHVADPEEVVDRIASLLGGGGTVVVLEWAWEALDEETAGWGFERLDPAEEGWLHRRRDGWLASGEAWEPYFRGWARGHGLHPAGLLVRLLDERFERRLLEEGPYLFPNLAVTEAEEQAAIDAGTIRATRVDYVGASVRSSD